MARTIVVYLISSSRDGNCLGLRSENDPPSNCSHPRPRLGASVDLSDVLGFTGWATITELGLLAFK